MYLFFHIYFFASTANQEYAKAPHNSCPEHQKARASLIAHLGKESACNAEDPGSIPKLGRSPGEGNCYLLQYSGLENSMDYIVHWGHQESDKTERLSLFTPKIT